jgi:hypothetical protein
MPGKEESYNVLIMNIFYNRENFSVERNVTFFAPCTKRLASLKHARSMEESQISAVRRDNRARLKKLKS